MNLATAVRVAQADAATAEGRLRERTGGGAAEVRGARLMASGLPFAKWNSAIVTAPEPDLTAVRRWFAAKAVPWGVRVPVDIQVTPGRHLFPQRCMGLLPTDFVPADGTVEIRRARPADAETVSYVDATAFGDDPASVRTWLEPQLADDCWHSYLAVIGGRPVGVATGVYTDGRAGPAVLVSGVGVLPPYRGRGIGAALSSRVVADALDAGVRLAHLNPDTDAAARIYARLGFVEVPGFEIYVDCD